MDLVLVRLVPFRLLEVEGLEKEVKGLTADLVIDICRGFVAALEAADKEGNEHKLTERQRDMAIKASMFLAACAKVGLDALIDEATGYQYERAEGRGRGRGRRSKARPLAEFLGNRRALLKP